MTPKKKKLEQTTTAPDEVSTVGKPAPVEEGATSFPIVGIGASAGGLAAFEAFFSGMPAEGDPGMAFILVQHLAPDHKSILADLVKRYTRMEVFEVTDGMEVRPNCTYIIPPNRDMAFLNGTLHLLEHTTSRGMRMTIDFFFRSLAQDQRERAICIVLSGTGSDGSVGVRLVKGEGGMAMAQSPESTKFAGMPSSAITTGLVDYVLPPAEMPARLIAYTAHRFSKKPRRISTPTASFEDIVKKVCILLRDQTGHDFSQYKRNILIQRIERRMAVHQISRAEDYLHHVRQTPVEAQALFRDLLIGVTNFFRDPEAFAVLEVEVIPELFVGKPVGAPVRVWVCGCASGEEAYSIAILLQEHLETLKKTFKVLVFATDLDPRAIEQARAGVYSARIVADITPERLARFFIQEPDSDTYHLQKIIRDLLVFSEQDVIKDPPFSKIDLISCRNLLIYLNGDLQKKLFPLFHYALNPAGVLLLGASESVGECGSLFGVLARKQNIYRRQKDLPGVIRPTFGKIIPSMTAQKTDRRRGTRVEPGETGRQNLREISDHSLVAHYAQSGVLVNSCGDILNIYGRTGKYLEPASGDAGMNILAMVNAELQRKVIDLSRANNDLNNLLASTGVATLFVDCHLHIVLFTPGITEVINLIHSDIGRPVAHMVSNLVNYDHLVEDVQRVLRDLVPSQAEVQTRSGKWFQMRIRPYRTLENVIEGSVITFIEITDQRKKPDQAGVRPGTTRGIVIKTDKNFRLT